MNRNHIQFVILTLGFVLSGAVAAADYAGGAGEPNDPYLIATTEQLLGAEFWQPGVHYRLCNDIDLAGETVWTSRELNGHLDGGGYSIRHATIGSSRYFQAFFAEVSREATITNLALVDFTVAVPDDDTRQVSYVGGLVAANAGAIANCAATGRIIACDGGAWIGGLVGVNGGEIDLRRPERSWRGAITNCCFEGAIIVDKEDAILGGLVGRNKGMLATCFAAGVVSGKTNVGGLVGSSDGPGSILNCYATAVVLAELGGGGLVGLNGGLVTRCYASGLVTGERRGGLVGMETWPAGSVTACLWDTHATNCETSGGGLGMSLVEKWDPQMYARNGWAGDPNWVMEPFTYYPRLAWERTEGEPIPDPEAWSFAGSGTEDDPYQIESVDQLAELAESSVLWDKHFVLVRSLSAWGKPQLRPIGICKGSAFSGTFDGQGNIIHYLSMSHDSAPVWNLGLFGYVTGQVRNLHSEIMAYEVGMNSHRIAFLAGTCDGGLIANCTTSGSIEAGMQSRCIGLLVGRCDGGTIENCSTEGSISVGANSESVGELVGYSRGEIVNCTSNVTVTAGEGSTDIGGLVGFEPEPRR